MTVSAKMLAVWIERQRNDFAARNLPSPSWLRDREFCAEQCEAELQALAHQRAKSFEAQEIRRLREDNTALAKRAAITEKLCLELSTRMKEVWPWFAPDKDGSAGIHDVMGRVLGELRKELHERIDKLEQRSLLPTNEPRMTWTKSSVTKN
jgi:hypothetical protein